MCSLVIVGIIIIIISIIINVINFCVCRNLSFLLVILINSCVFSLRDVYRFLSSSPTPGVAQSVWGLALEWTVRGSNPGGGEILRAVQAGPEAHPVSCTTGVSCRTPISKG